MEAIILAGGFGKRLQTVVSDLPKPMAAVNNKPFLNYILNYLSRNNVTKAIFATGHLHQKIEDYYGLSYNELELDYSIETEKLGTGGCIKQAFSKATSDNILILNGDSFFDVSIHDILTVHKDERADLTLALKPMHNISRYGIVKIDRTKVISFEEKKKVAFGYINAGVYLAQIDLFDGFDLPERFSIEEDFLKKFTSRLNIHACVSDGYFIDIGIPEDYEKAQIDMMKYE